MRRKISLWLWRHRREWMLRKNGFGNHSLLRDSEFLDVFVDALEHRRILLNLREIHNLYRFALQTAAIPGDVAEVGVYRGGSARVLGRFKGARQLHLFDTFEGMPEVDPAVDLHHAGDFADTSLASVRAFLADLPGLHFHPGRFPETAGGLSPGARFSLVHLDVDIYASTLDALRYFYPRVSPGGVIVSHDYRTLTCPGVKRAVDEFFADRPETVIELWDTQCAVVKVAPRDP